MPTHCSAPRSTAAPHPPRQGARDVRGRRPPPAAGGDRSALGLRRRVRPADPGQGRRPDPAVGVVVRAARRPRSLALRVGRARPACPRRRGRRELAARSMLVRRAERVDAECVVRGYLAGSGWAEYRRSGEVCGHRLPDGLREADRLPEPIFTPSTKAEVGHDENISRAAARRHGRRATWPASSRSAPSRSTSRARDRAARRA